MLKHFDLGSLLVISITFSLFAAALFVKGLKHDLLLEAGVFLVSVKLIIMAHKNSIHAQAIQEKIDKLYAAVTGSGSSGSEKLPPSSS